MRFTLSLIVLWISASVSSALSLPDALYGKWTNFANEYLDDYLEAKGYGFYTRKLMMMSSSEKTIAKNAESTAKFDFAEVTSKTSVAYKGVELGKQFIGKGIWDDAEHKVTFSLKDGVLLERHEAAIEEEFEYKIEGEKLVVTMKAGDVIAKRFYQRV